MKVELEIRDDKELRKYIKNYIRGVIDGMARDEIKDAVIDAASTKITEASIYELFRRLKIDTVEVGKIIRESLSEYSQDRLKTMIDHSVIAAGIDMRREIKHQAKVAVNEMVKNLNKDITIKLSTDA